MGSYKPTKILNHPNSPNQIDQSGPVLAKNVATPGLNPVNFGGSTRSTGRPKTRSTYQFQKEGHKPHRYTMF
jgi:hypothetical protein